MRKIVKTFVVYDGPNVLELEIIERPDENHLGVIRTYDFDTWTFWPGATGIANIEAAVNVVMTKYPTAKEIPNLDALPVGSKKVGHETYVNLSWTTDCEIITAAEVPIGSYVALGPTHTFFLFYGGKGSVKRITKNFEGHLYDEWRGKPKL